MEWSEGYVADVPYTTEFFGEQAPDFLNCVAIINGYEPVATDKPFTYFELGCGHALTLNILAAGNPLGQFYGVDFMPSHIAAGCALADAAKLDNLTLLDSSFADLASGKVADIPQCDFITLHGVYSWISADNQLHIVSFIRQYLKPGGIVYVSYNALPGWNAAMPLSRLLVAHANLHPAQSTIQLQHAAAFIQQFDIEQAGFFSTTPALKDLLGVLNRYNPTYLVHEYLNQNAAPLYHMDLVRDLGSAKMDYVGSADLCQAYPDLYFNEQKLALINAVPNSPLRETVKDFLLNTRFRKDVFVRGARKMGITRQKALLKKITLALVVPKQGVQLNGLNAGTMTFNVHQDIILPAIEALAICPRTLAELATLPSLEKESLIEIAKLAMMLTTANQTTVCTDRPRNVSATARLNLAIAHELHYSDQYGALASPAVGSGIALNPVELLVYGILRKPSPPNGQDVGTIALEVQKILDDRGRRLRVNGVPIESEKQNMAEITRHVTATLKAKLPLWRQLGIL